MFIPYGTDAPCRYPPIATVVLIVVNILVFALTSTVPDEALMRYALVRGHGLHPVQWLTSCFMHAHLMHLVGNMIFLWAFGLVVEGKVGAWRFVMLYLAIGISGGAFAQLISLGAEHRPAIGASGAIYGLIGVCAIWAPANNLTCAYFLGYSMFARTAYGTINVAILMFAIFYIGWEFLAVVAYDREMSTPFLHLTGGVLGLVLGWFTFKVGLVDCENWDIISVMTGHEGRPADRKKGRPSRARRRAAAHAAGRGEDAGPSESAGPVAAAPARARRTHADGGPGADPSDAATRRLRRHLEAGEALAAHSAYDRSMRTVPGWAPDAHDWQQLMKSLLDAKESRLAVGVMEDYLRRAGQPSPRVRLKLAQLLLHEFERPAHAQRVLRPLEGQALPPEVEAFRTRLVAEAGRMSEEGVLELDGDTW